MYNSSVSQPSPRDRGSWWDFAPEEVVIPTSDILDKGPVVSSVNEKPLDSSVVKTNQVDPDRVSETLVIVKKKKNKSKTVRDQTSTVGQSVSKPANPLEDNANVVRSVNREEGPWNRPSGETPAPTHPSQQTMSKPTSVSKQCDVSVQGDSEKKRNTKQDFKSHHPNVM